MTEERWQQVRGAFLAICDLPPDEQAAALEKIDLDASVHAEVRELLAAAQRPLTQLDTPPSTPLLDKLRARDDGQLVGRRFGAYELMEYIASGGMGAVYRARRADEQFERTVAVKVMRAALIDPPNVLRFRQERQTLANLDHAYIAKLIDGGLTPDGTPYLVMEHIDGQPIDAYAAEHRLDNDARLRLFLKVCAAVQYAHRNLVVHRDLKPGNIFVTADGTPKLLDFGIAKVLEPGQDASPVTHTHRAMTPEYASPEQIRGQPITTASDVYALGVILYELLTGVKPYRFKSRALRDVELAVCEQEPQRPSTAVLRRGHGASAATESDSTSGGGDRGLDSDAVRLRRGLRGNLDAIVLTALRKGPQHRYASVEQFAGDITNHLRGLPILARRMSPFERMLRLVNRHRLAAAAALAVAASLAFGMAGILWQSRIAAEQRDRATEAALRARAEADSALVEVRKAERVTGFLKEILTSVTPHGLGRDITMREALDHAAEAVQRQFGDDPEVESAVRTAIGEAYLGLGELALAAPQFEIALALQKRLHDGDHADVARARRNLAMLRFEQGDLEHAAADARQALDMHVRLYGRRHPEVAQDLNNLGVIESWRGDADRAEALLREALALRRENDSAAGALRVAETLNNMGNLYRRTQALAQAERVCREALEIRSRLLPSEHPDTAQSSHNLAVVLATLGRYAEAEALLKELLPIHRKLLGPNHPNVGTELSSLATVLLAQAKYAEAASVAREAVAVRTASLGADDARTRYSKGVLGQALAGADRFEEAEQVLLALYEASRSEAGAEDATTEAWRTALLDLYRRWGKPVRQTILTRPAPNSSGDQ